MKKALIAGCSHSTSYGLKEGSKNWGEVYSCNNNYIPTNIAEPGTSVQYSIQKIVEEINNNYYDLVLLQLSTLDRFPIPMNGESKFLNNDILFEDKNTPELFHLLPSNYLEAVDGVKLPLPVEIIKYFNEKVTFSNFYLKTLINEIFLLQNALKTLNSKLLLIPYDEHFWGDDSYMSIWRLPYSGIIDKTNYINTPFKQWLAEKYPGKNFFIDKGFHLNQEGHRIFAEEYIPPKFQNI